VQRYSCKVAERKFGVKAGAKWWCWRQVVQATVVKVADSTPVAGQKVFVLRVVKRKPINVGSATTKANGKVTLTTRIMIPAAQRKKLALANKWIAAQYAKTLLRHTASGGVDAASAVAFTTRR
jgi:hypothetical protein